MKSLSSCTLLVVLFLSGCSVHHAVELRPYSDEEVRELALEDLNRRGLSYEEYQSKKTLILTAPHISKPQQFDNRGEISAEHAVTSSVREG